MMSRHFSFYIYYFATYAFYENFVLMSPLVSHTHAHTCVFFICRIFNLKHVDRATRFLREYKDIHTNNYRRADDSTLFACYPQITERI